MANKEITNLKDHCRSIFSHRDFAIENDKGELIQDTCYTNCINLETNINNLKKLYGIATNSYNGQCGFSWNLINFIANIVKWGKYLIPVAVIILSILDFIKAISSEKEDEMKKAQGNFVKRLVIAALIFIIPFIIEFILDKIGFDANGCGIIDL